MPENIPIAPHRPSTDNAARPDSREAVCPPNSGEFSTVTARERQVYANQCIRHWQRKGLAFPDLLALFRLAGKAYDRGCRL